MPTELRKDISHLLRRFAPPPQRGGQSGHLSATTSRPYGNKRHGSEDPAQGGLTASATTSFILQAPPQRKGQYSLPILLHALENFTLAQNFEKWYKLFRTSMRV